MIRLQDLRKSYGLVEAVKGISLNVSAGECFGLLGPNGAGKTTVARLLLRLTQPDSGTVSLFGQSVTKIPREIYRRIGVVFDNANLYDEVSVVGNLTYAAASYGAPRERVNLVIQQFGLEAHRNKKVRHLSKGLKQRAAIARAVIHDPELLILDEPTSGLDPDVAQDVRAILADLHRSGKTLLLISHIMQEVEQLCSRVAIVKDGQIAVSGSVAELRDRFANELVLRVRGNPGPVIAQADTLGLRLVEQTSDAVQLAGRPPEVWSALRNLLSQDPLSQGIKEVHAAGPSLEEVYIRVVSGS